MKSADTTCPNGHNSECNNGQHCVSGTCRTGKKGSTCSQHGDCDDNMYCEKASSSCQPRANEGDSCNYDLCEKGLECMTAQHDEKKCQKP